MNILQINSCHYHRGGSETVYFNTSQILKEHGHNVAFFSTKDNRNEPNEFEQYFISAENIRSLSIIAKIKKIPSYLYNRSAIKKLELLLNYFKPDIAHVHLFYADLSISILKTLKKHKIPIVHTVHDYRLLCPVNTLLDKDGKICELCRDKHFFHCLQKKCSDGKFNQSLIVMLEAYLWKYFMKPVDYIDNFIFVSKFIRDKHLSFNSDFKNKYSQLYNFTNFNPHDNSSTKGDYFLFFGRLSVEKGIKTLLSVFLRRKDLKLVIAGTGPLKSYVEDSIKDSHNIEYAGFKTGEELGNLIKNASFIILPSEWYENNPLSLIEAYNFGKPVIGANMGGIPELISDGSDGFVFESGNAQSLESKIDSSLKISDAEYESFSQSVFEFARQNFNRENHYLKLLQIYLDVINKKGNKQTHTEIRES
jgi:glycosyltransferase involved in cell wall biosynthesis